MVEINDLTVLSSSMFLVGSVQLEVKLMPASHFFEVSGNGNLAVSGKLRKCKCVYIRS